MNSTIFLAEENRQLRGENERQKKNRAKSRATGGILTVQEGLDLTKRANIEPKSRVAESEAIV
jgi:hypothetical protein